jgi:hypothetical protein
VSEGGSTDKFLFATNTPLSGSVWNWSSDGDGGTKLLLIQQ